MLHLYEIPSISLFYLSKTYLFRLVKIISDILYFPSAKKGKKQFQLIFQPPFRGNLNSIISELLNLTVFEHAQYAEKNV